MPNASVRTWLEMSRDAEHGGLGWGFGECLWAPPLTEKGTRWPFWGAVRNVREGDVIVHLRGASKPAFVGCSVAAADGHETCESPPHPKGWAFSKSFLRVQLKHFTPFDEPIDLRSLFRDREHQFRGYYLANANRRGAAHRHVFFVPQAGRLQCLNGAYLSELDGELAAICLGEQRAGSTDPRTAQQVESVYTGRQLRMVNTRVGQQEFSQHVRDNFAGRCCFPKCTVTDTGFLVGAHIARWADAQDLRGNVCNGLCFCLMHDRAFEHGLFTLDAECRVRVNHDKAATVTWSHENLTPYDGCEVAQSGIRPSLAALSNHWRRINFVPAASQTTGDGAKGVSKVG